MKCPGESQLPLEEALRTGSFAPNQIFSRSAVVAWSHRRRFDLARRLVMPHAGRRLLDYGCGDGTFLAVISDLFPNAMGTDADQRQVENCKQRFEKITSLSFKSVQELTDPGYQQFFDVVICTEVLEHCLDAEANKLLHNLNGLCAQGGIIIISVPVEIGLALIVKQVVRMIAGWRRIGYYEYRERYTPKDFWRMLFADADTSIARVVHSYGNAIGFHGHHGFNWRTLETRISR